MTKQVERKISEENNDEMKKRFLNNNKPNLEHGTKRDITNKYVLKLILNQALKLSVDDYFTVM